MKASASLIGQIRRTGASLVTAINSAAIITEQTGLRRYLRVSPEEAQTIMWVVPGDMATYNIESNTQWGIE